MIFSGNENWLAWLLGRTALQAPPKVEWRRAAPVAVFPKR